jgi:cell wall-associated NlpC family hydrolase
MIDWDRYIGIPWQDLGRDEAGTDCWGLLRLVYGREFKVPLPSGVGLYLSADDLAEVARVIEGGRGPWRELERGAEREGDAILMRWRGHACHCGVVVDPREGKMLHQWRGTNSSLAWYKGERALLWRRLIESFHRHEALT